MPLNSGQAMKETPEGNMLRSLECRVAQKGLEYGSRGNEMSVYQ